MFGESSIFQCTCFSSHSAGRMSASELTADDILGAETGGLAYAGGAYGLN